MKLRGHPIYHTGKEWRYSDNDEPTATTHLSRNCGHCGMNTIDKVDPCLGSLPGVMNACCGHGERKESYIQFIGGFIIRGFQYDYEREK